MVYYKYRIAAKTVSILQLILSILSALVFVGFVLLAFYITVQDVPSNLDNRGNKTTGNSSVNEIEKLVEILAEHGISPDNVWVLWIVVAAYGIVVVMDMASSVHLMQATAPKLLPEFAFGKIQRWKYLFLIVTALGIIQYAYTNSWIELFILVLIRLTLITFGLLYLEEVRNAAYYQTVSSSPTENESKDHI